MTISVAPGAADVPGDLGGRFLVLVRHAGDATPVAAGLAAARSDIASLGPAVVSPVVRSPEGPLLRVGGLDADEEALQSVPALVATALARHGVTDAAVELLEPVGPLDQLDGTIDAAILRLFPAPAGADGVIPLNWLEVAADWVLADTDADTPVALRLLGAAFDLPARDAIAMLHEATTSRAWCDLVHGDLRRRIRTASLTFGHAPHLALAAGGPGCDDGALLARFDLLGEVARDIDGAAYACVDLEPTFAAVGTGLSKEGWAARGGAAPNAVVAQVGDVVVPDTYPLQILGPAHLDRFAGGGNEPIDGTPLASGRMVVNLGDPAHWLPNGGRRAHMVDLGCKVLAPLLVTDAQLAQLLRTRTPANAPTPGAKGWLDLDQIVLEPLPHTRRGLRLTLLELASWLGYEPHSDVPVSVSPVLAVYARWYASALDDDERQDLKRYAARLIGTREPGLVPTEWQALGARDEARAWLAAEWLARVQAPVWLRAAGQHRAAKALARVRPTTGAAHRAQLLDLLDAAAAELGASGTAASGSDLAWEVWEQAADATGWVAASEAAWVGLPDAVASAAELRAVEITRAVLPTPEVACSQLVRAATAEAAGAETWRLAGEAAASADGLQADDPSLYASVAPVPLTTAWERSVRAAGTRAGQDRDSVESALEDAENAAVQRLAELIAAEGSPTDPLTIACTAAARAGGPPWHTVTELACGVVGEGNWRTLTKAARTTARRIVEVAPPMIDRAVMVSLAREACGLAARTAVDSSGPGALERAVATLRPQARKLFDALFEVDPQGP